MDVLAKGHFPNAYPYAHHPCSLKRVPRGPPSKESEAMNIAMTERKPVAAHSLKAKVSLITGSTSGIGLGIARALAGAGSAIVLNGFGKPEAIAETQAGIVSEFGVKAHYSP